MQATVAVGGGRMFDGSLTHNHEATEDNDNADADTGMAMPLGLSSSLAKRLASSAYECMICCDKVRPRHAIWQCDTCWAIFHIGCVKKWAKSCSDGPNVRWR
ncbi:Transcriptional repressor NF-X1, partial [Coemansia sp. RSA 2559]